MSSEPTVEAPERRLHPLSFLFTLLVQLRQFVFPLVAAFFFGRGRGGPGDEYALVGVGMLTLLSVAQYFTYRYRIERDAIVVRSGVFQRSLRHIPFARIQNVSLHQNPLHRLFRVAEVRLESAGAAKPEAQMRVLRLSDAHALEEQIRAGAHAAPSADGAAPAPAAPARLLLALDTPEVLRLGVISNRGMLIVAAGFAALAQLGDNVMQKLFRTIGGWVWGHASSFRLSWLATAAAALLLLLLLLAGLRLLSIVWALLKFHGFRLSEMAGRLSVERGLLTRVRSSLPRHRIQSWTLEEGVLHRWFGRRSLRVDSAVLESGGAEKSPIKDLAPLATPQRIDELVRELLAARGPGAATWPPRQWQPLHAHAWRREFWVPALLLGMAALAGAAWRTPWALLALALLPVLYWNARLWAKHSAWAVADGLVAFRSGWLGKHWRFAETRKLQALELRQSPFDRRWGMATLHFDTAGAGAMEPALAIRYLPVDTARALFDQLSAALEK
jgi:putative membrane protein